MSVPAAVSPQSGAARRARWVRPRAISFCLACALFAGASWWAVVASRQPLVRILTATDSPPAPTPLLSSAWWLYPYEVNAARRLPVLHGDLLSVSFAADARHGWILGRGNILLQTDNGGETWSEIRPQFKNNLGNTSAKAAWTTRAGGWPLAMIGVQKVAAGDLPSREELPAQFRQQGPGSAEENAVDPYSIKNSANAMRRPPSQPKAVELKRIEFTDARSGKAVARDAAMGTPGDVWTTTDAGAVWTLLPPNLYDNATYTFLEQRADRVTHGNLDWKVTLKGEIICSSKSWKAEVVASDRPALKSIAFATDARGWVVGEQGRVLRTIDGGRTWYRASIDPSETSALGPYCWFPPPLYGLALFSVLGLMVAGWRIRDEVVERQVSVEDILLSDRPLEPGEPDVLGFGSLALGLSNFLRNERTEPPLTLAITGAWGSGKSSLMNLLSGDLKRHGLRPVWFNAWHHQTEEHLLAALLENIRSQAVPGWWNDGGFLFRWRLLMGRLRKDWPLWSVIGGVFVFSAAFVATCQTFSVEGVLQLATRLLNALGFGDAADTGSREAGDAALSVLKKPSALLAAISLLAGLVKIITAMRAFAAKPSNLLLSQSAGLRLKDLSAQTSFRYHFAREFSEVTAALGSRRMTIFIDDLDRCQPKQIYEMLESTNFLVSCGRCFVVLGLARERIERAIGVVFKDLAEANTDELDAVDADSAPLTETEKQNRFAAQYLEKLINVDVSVPRPDEADYKRLFETRKESRQRMMGRVSGMLAACWPLLVLLSTIIALGLVGLLVGESSRAPAPKAAASSEMVAAPPSEPSAVEHRQETPATFSAGSTWSPSGWWFMPAGVLLATAIFWRLSSRPAVRKVDSREFSDTLERYLPLVAQKHGTTPRSLKRFVNRVRYYAMIQRGGEPELSQWDRIVAWSGSVFKKRKQESEPKAVLTSIPPTGVCPWPRSPAPSLGRSPGASPGDAAPTVPFAAARAELMIGEEDLITLSAWQEVRGEGKLGEDLAAAAARIDKSIRQRFEKLKSGVHVGP